MGNQARRIPHVPVSSSSPFFFFSSFFFVISQRRRSPLLFRRRSRSSSTIKSASSPLPADLHGEAAARDPQQTADSTINATAGSVQREVTMNKMVLHQHRVIISRTYHLTIEQIVPTGTLQSAGQRRAGPGAGHLIVRGFRGPIGAAGRSVDCRSKHSLQPHGKLRLLRWNLAAFNALF